MYQINQIKHEVMFSRINRSPVDQEIQVYRNDFYSGVMRLVRKLFML